MNILLLRPDPGSDKFGLGPFFQVEPLGLEYVGAVLRKRGDSVTIADLRFRPGLGSWISRTRPRIIGISCLHALEYDRIIATAHEARRLAPDALIIVGGHAAAAYPDPLEHDLIDAICLDDGEEVVPLLAAAIEGGEPLATVPALRVRTGEGWITTAPLSERTSLDLVPLPARDMVERYRNGYHCLLFKPVWLIETARGCPHRCNFCSVWKFYGRTCRERSVARVVDDFAASGDAVFVADDLFWYNPARSLEMAEALKKRGVYKRWILVQTRTDLIRRSADLMAAWRPLAKDFDIFLGLEAATDRGLTGIDKDADVTDCIEAVRIARELKYGINGNFLVDHDWGENDFRELWEFVERYSLQRAGFTILTPLPGTDFYQECAKKMSDQPWSNFDMHHLLWEPRMGAERFFQLYAETWRRSILNTSGDKGIIDWMRQVRPSQIPYIVRVLWRTQRMMKPAAYVAEYAESRIVSNNLPRARQPSEISGGGGRGGPIF
jgi:hopanoid C-3 methylase